MPILRVFPRRTSMTPTDPYAFVGDPPLWRPAADEVHVSATFTWDILEAYRLRDAWANHYETVKIGGPAVCEGQSEGFEPGMYLKDGVTITSRGCPHDCAWCLVPLREEYRLLPIRPGWIVQDNNLLATPRSHKREVFAMLKSQCRAVSFPGGLEARRVDTWVAEELRSLRVKQIFLAADTVAALGPLERALDRLAFLPQWKLRVYTMIAYNGETLIDAEARMEAVWQMGGAPFAQLYQPPDRYIKYSSEWKALARTWSRPAAMAAAHGGWT